MSSGWKKARRLSGKCVGCEGVGCEGVGCEGVGSYSICIYALYDTCVSYEEEDTCEGLGSYSICVVI